MPRSDFENSLILIYFDFVCVQSHNCHVIQFSKMTRHHLYLVNWMLNTEWKCNMTSTRTSIGSTYMNEFSIWNDQSTWSMPSQISTYIFFTINIYLYNVYWVWLKLMTSSPISVFKVLFCNPIERHLMFRWFPSWLQFPINPHIVFSQSLYM